MSELSADELRELLVGTWIGIASIAEILVQKGLISRAEMGSVLLASATMTEGRRREAVHGIRDYIGTGLANEAIGRLPVPVSDEKRWPNPSSYREPPAEKPYAERLEEYHAMLEKGAKRK